MSTPQITPSRRIRVTQTIEGREQSWQSQIEGTVVEAKSRPTGSWYAHGKNDKLWLNRIRLKRDDGELVDLVINGKTKVEFLD